MKQFNDEWSYARELSGWLKREFSDVAIEVQKGSSRPDIVIGDIAIEVKGPTDDQALNTVSTKILKYTRYYRYMIIVLFKPEFSEGNYGEIVAGMKTHHPNVEVIRKNSRGYFLPSLTTINAS